MKTSFFSFQKKQLNLCDNSKSYCKFVQKKKIQSWYQTDVKSVSWSEIWNEMHWVPEVILLECWFCISQVNERRRTVWFRYTCARSHLTTLKRSHCVDIIKTALCKTSINICRYSRRQMHLHKHHFISAKK